MLKPNNAKSKKNPTKSNLLVKGGYKHERVVSPFDNTPSILIVIFIQKLYIMLGKKIEEVEKKLHDPEDKKTDEWYKNYIEQYKNSEFYEQLKMNPYLRENNAAYENSFFENLFGSNKGAAQYYEDLVNARNEYMTEILGQMREQTHNDPANEIERRKNAGINDDLSGGQAIGTGEAAQNDQPSGQAPQMGDDTGRYIQQAQAIWNTFQSAYSMTMGILMDTQKYKVAQNEVESGDIENAGKYAEIAKMLFEFGISMGKTGDKQEQKAIPSGAYDFRKLFRNEKRFRKFADAYTTATESMQGYKTIIDKEKEYKDTAVEGAYSEGRYRAAGFTPMAMVGGDVARDFAQKFAKMTMKMNKIETSTKISELKGMKKYYKTIDWEAKGIMENESVGANRKKIAIQQVINDFMSGITTDLQERSKEKGPGGVLASILLGAISLQSMGMLPTMRLPTINVTHRAGNQYVTNNTMY